MELKITAKGNLKDLIGGYRRYIFDYIEQKSSDGKKYNSDPIQLLMDFNLNEGYRKVLPKNEGKFAIIETGHSTYMEDREAYLKNAINIRKEDGSFILRYNINTGNHEDLHKQIYSHIKEMTENLIKAEEESECCNLFFSDDAEITIENPHIGQRLYPKNKYGQIFDFQKIDNGIKDFEIILKDRDYADRALLLKEFKEIS